MIETQSRSLFRLHSLKYFLPRRNSNFAAVNSHVDQLEDYAIELKFPRNKENAPASLKLNRIWLRHHCRCPLCFNPVTHQRRTGISKSIFQESKIARVEFRTDNTTAFVNVDWNDGHQSIYDFEWLNWNAPKTANGDSSGNRISRNWMTEGVNPKSLFKHAKIPTAESFIASAIPYKDFMQNEQSLKQFFRNILDTGFGMVTNSSADLDTIRNIHNRIAHPHRSFFGDGVSVATSDMKYNDTAYTSEALALHTDTTYFTEPMGLQSFHVLHHDGTGGLNSFADGFQAAKLLYEEDKSKYALLSTIPVPGEYFDPGRYHYSSLGLTFDHNLETVEFERIRFNPLDMGVLSGIPADKTTIFYEAMVRLSTLLEEQTMWLQLRPGTTLFIDNWRILHGRSEFTGSRKMASAYFPKSDWLSRARVVGAL